MEGYFKERRRQIEQELEAGKAERKRERKSRARRIIFSNLVQLNHLTRAGQATKRFNESSLKDILRDARISIPQEDQPRVVIDTFYHPLKLLAAKLFFQAAGNHWTDRKYQTPFDRIGLSPELANDRDYVGAYLLWRPRYFFEAPILRNSPYAITEMKVYRAAFSRVFPDGTIVFTSGTGVKSMPLSEHQNQRNILEPVLFDAFEHPFRYREETATRTFSRPSQFNEAKRELRRRNYTELPSR